MVRAGDDDASVNFAGIKAGVARASKADRLSLPLVRLAPGGQHLALTIGRDARLRMRPLRGGSGGSVIALDHGITIDDARVW